MILELEKDLFNVASTDQKIKMEKYLKNKFEFFGVPAPKRQLVQKKYVDESKNLDLNELKKVITELHNFGKREMLYVAKDMALKNISRLDYKFIIFLVDLTLINSWWENTDSYNAVIKRFFLKDRSNLKRFIVWYSNEDNIWLKRISIICQLGFKGSHDRELVKIAVVNCMACNDFFVQKAIGWILRDISKYDREFVIELLGEYDFSNLVVSEATKNMR